MLRMISSFESGIIISRQRAARMYGTAKLRYQSKSYLNGIKKARQTNAATILSSRKKVAHCWRLSWFLNLRLIDSRSRFVIELRWNKIAANRNTSVHTPVIVVG